MDELNTKQHEAMKDISIDEYNYELPDERIAIFPLAERDASKLLVYKNGVIQEDIYRNVAQHIPSDSLLIFNNTKVIAARILFQKTTGGEIEIFCLEPDNRHADINLAMSEQKEAWWKCLIGGASKWKKGMMLEKEIDEDGTTLRASMEKKEQDHFIIHFQWNNNRSFAQVIENAGAIPLPPYIKRKADTADKERYQTIYAAFNGSVAAPTAGLHFTPNVFESLKAQGTGFEFVTLHVGAGTFKPVKSKTIGEHDMHSEWIEVEAFVIERLLQNINSPTIAVGTTSLRTVETLYWLGIKALKNPDIEPQALSISQWESYQMEADHSASDALHALLLWMNKNNLHRISTKTQLLIAPGYRFRIIQGLITNFHQPKSTLLLLVAALIGKDWHNVYAYALSHNFRFLSYGDGCLLFGNNL